MVTASRVKVTLVVAIPLPYYHTASLPAALRQYGHARAPRSVLWTGSVIAEHGSGYCARGARESSTLFLTPRLNALCVLALPGKNDFRNVAGEIFTVYTGVATNANAIALH
jgi:hypothetical protein